MPPKKVTLTPPTQIESAPFTLNGRLSINFQNNRHSAGLHWNHQLKSDEIMLLAPLGQTVARITSDAQQATLDQGEQHFQAKDVEALMTQVLGWHLPLKDLYYWVLGLQASDSPALIERDDLGRISMLQQAGWNVEYIKYAESTPNSLPSRLQLSHEDLRVKIIIDEWNWNPK